MSWLQADGITYSYDAGSGALPAVDRVSLDVDPGQQLALMGPSGSGKSTVLHCLAGVLVPTAGRVLLEGRDLGALDDKRRSRVRLEQLGLVFQSGDLVPELTLLENVALPLELLRHDRRTSRARARALLEELGVADVADQRAGTVSGGQAQRAAVARALVHEPRVVLADEPTGALDSVTSERVLDIMTAATRRIGAALVVVTHDHVVASHLDTLVTLRDGRVEVPVP